VDDKSADLLYLCLVLGGITEKEINFLKKEFNRVLKENGLICLIENKLQDQEHREESLSLNSYALESMPLEIILQMEKTMALLEFDSSGKVLEKCQLFDLEKDSDKADETASTSALPIIKSDFKTMQEAINKCRELTEKVVPLDSPEQSSPNITTDNSISLFSLWRGFQRNRAPELIRRTGFVEGSAYSLI